MPKKLDEAALLRQARRAIAALLVNNRINRRRIQKLEARLEQLDTRVNQISRHLLNK